MTEITQADRDAAAQAFFCKPLLSEKYNEDRRVLAFARHREQAERETVEKIVAWLNTAPHLLSCFAAADAIEAGEWKQ